MAETLHVGDLTVLAERASDASRPPILFVHGYLAGAWVFEPFMRFFAARGHDCFAVNLRGRFGSRPDVDVGRIAMAEFLVDARIVAQHVGRPIVVGHSMGGLIAQQLAEEGLSVATVLLAPAPPKGISVFSLSAFVHQVRYLPALLRSRPVVARFPDFQALVLNRLPSEQQQAAFARFVPDSGYAGREMLLGRIAVDERKIRGPMLVVSGDDDHFIPLPTSRRVAAKYGAPLHVVRGHAHLLVQEPGWEEIATFIAEWVASKTPQQPGSLLSPGGAT